MTGGDKMKSCSILAPLILLLQLPGCNDKINKNEINLNNEFVYEKNQNSHCYKINYNSQTEYKMSFNLKVDKKIYFNTDCEVALQLSNIYSSIKINILYFDYNILNNMHKQCRNNFRRHELALSDFQIKIKDIYNALENNEKKCVYLYVKYFKIEKENLHKYYRFKKYFSDDINNANISPITKNISMEDLYFINPISISNKNRKEINIYCGYFEGSDVSLARKNLNGVISACLSKLI
jgi:hypothetical protein